MIRSMETRDLERVVELWRSGNMEAHGFIPAAYWRANEDFVRAELPKAEVYVYETGGTIKGFLGLQGDYIAGLFVDRRSRSRGIGRELLDHVKGRRAALWLKVYRDNRDAVRFYRREGFCLASESVDPDTGAAENQMIWRREET